MDGDFQDAMVMMRAWSNHQQDDASDLSLTRMTRLICQRFGFPIAACLAHATQGETYSDKSQGCTKCWGDPSSSGQMIDALDEHRSEALFGTVGFMICHLRNRCLQGRDDMEYSNKVSTDESGTLHASRSTLGFRHCQSAPH